MIIFQIQKANMVVRWIMNCVSLLQLPELHFMKMHIQCRCSQSYFDDTAMMLPKQVQFLLYKITRDITNSTYGKVTTLLYPKMMQSIFLQVYSEFFRQPCNTTFPTLQPNNLCVLQAPQGVLLTMTQMWWSVQLNFSFINPVNIIIKLKIPSWETQLSWSFLLLGGIKQL